MVPAPLGTISFLISFFSSQNNLEAGEAFFFSFNSFDPFVHYKKENRGVAYGQNSVEPRAVAVHPIQKIRSTTIDLT